MKFNVAHVTAEVEGLSLEEQGAYFVLIRQLWVLGPLTDAQVRRYVRGNFDAVRDRMVERDGLLTFDWLEDAREAGQRYQNQRSKAGTISASKRNETPTTVQRPYNDRSTDVLSMSISKSDSHSLSSSESDSDSSETRDEKNDAGFIAAEVWPTFADWWEVYGKKVDRAKCERKWAAMTQAEREQAYRHTEAYVIATPELQYRRHPATYLNNANWNDEELTRPRTQGGHQGHRSLTFAERVAAAAGIAPDGSNGPDVG